MANGFMSYIDNYEDSTWTTAAITSNIITLTGSDTVYYGNAWADVYGTPAKVMAEPRPETEVDWLRRRVDEVCWREAA